MFIRSLAGASHILTYRYSATLARAYYNKSVSLVPYQLLPPYLRNQCLNSLVNFFSLSKDIISNWALISF